MIPLFSKLECSSLALTYTLRPSLGAFPKEEFRKIRVEVTANDKHSCLLYGNELIRIVKSFSAQAPTVYELVP